METLHKNVGIDQDYKIEISDKLNLLLANYQVHYMNLRGMHWNVKGSNFFLLHEKFEELYTEATETVDEIAERILTLDQQPLHTFEDYLDNKTIRIIKEVSDGATGISLLIDNLNELLIQEREILEFSSDNNDEGTATLISDLISGQEKLIWMLKSTLQ
ncbi:MAG: DNA starvation/stationary phase protection protein [Maribacter dokdonensis]|uniref:Starvation-inducible DNA-binding protein n=1 Tax=Maribacter dokdonensis TaxID=320912 RepID=A0ABY0U9H6_9FLAO|nr:DNA starvation/stationary phase protection protein [Maribacter dokdonensis]SDS22890.1 starvation-inducible DNA-binding protein [Maribacter dokdonensis]